MISKLKPTLLLAALIFALAPYTAAAQNSQGSRSSSDNSRQRSPRKTRIRMEWGGMLGLNLCDFSTPVSGVDVKNKLGWQAGIVTAVDFGAFAIEPQILYVRQGLRIRPEGERELNLKSNSIDVPILLSLRILKPVRFYVGPVLTMLNDCKQKSGGDLLDFGRIRPTFSYTAGVSVLLRHFLIDLRYNGQFRSKHDILLPDGSRLDRLRSFNVALSVGYVF